MKTALVITHLLSVLLPGVIIAGIISEEPLLWGWGLFLLFVDIVVGVLLQRRKDAEESLESKWNSLSDEEKQDVVREALEATAEQIRREEEEKKKNDTDEAKEKKEDAERDSKSGGDPKEDEEDLYDRLCEIYNEMSEAYPVGTAKPIERAKDFFAEEAGCFLFMIHMIIKHAPMVAFSRIEAIGADHFGGTRTLIYCFKYPLGVTNQIAYLFLVGTRARKLRLFAVETSLHDTFMLCEYSDGHHINYGQVEVAEIPERLGEVLTSGHDERSIFKY